MENIADSVSNIFSNVAEWAKQPLTEQMDVIDWALFTGLIIALSIVWFMVLRELENLG